VRPAAVATDSTLGCGADASQGRRAQHLGGEHARIGCALQLERHHHVLERVQVAEQLELWNTNPTWLQHRCARVFIDLEQVGTGSFTVPVVGVSSPR